MEDFLIVKGSDYLDKHTYARTQSTIFQKYDSFPLQVNTYHYKKGSMLYLDPVTSDEAVKTYYILSGHCKMIEMDAELETGDLFVLRVKEGVVNLYMLEDTVILVHGIHGSPYTSSKNRADNLNNILEEIQAKDQYTKDHCERVYVMSLKMGIRLKYNSKKFHHFYDAARYHDIGKVFIDDEILNKAGALTDLEYQDMKTHVVLGKELFMTSLTEESFEILMQHHERLDGSGYPKGLKGDEISEEGRLLAIIDSFDAMVTDRVYKKGKTVEQAIDELRRYSDKWYDRSLVEAFIEMIQEDV